MKKNEKKVEFDLSALSLRELIEVYQAVTEFLQYIDDSKIKLKEMENENG